MSDRPWTRRLPSGDAPLFVYGTLQFPEVLIELIGRAPQLDPAQVLGQRAAVLPDRVYPGLTSANDSVTQGFLLSGLTADEWQVLDAFEDDEYELRPIPVHAGDQDTYAWTYIWTDAVPPGEWSAQRFAAEHLADYITRCSTWRRDLLRPATAQPVPERHNR
ncbi:MAG: AIG2-like protein [Nocardia sp.]|uniref:gamma-glutamylcyclotransferase family protein n=1 Tax=Nocardia sp. TaxID=1821 RepID=UPI002613E7FC|nr:gamma-glutamylcyclotransferase family protein [Nocardia sp.]MCU1644799.1 AIG2-like protein [Nocardia sp.]